MSAYLAGLLVSVGGRLLLVFLSWWCFFFFFQAEDGIRDTSVTGVQTCALPIFRVELLGPAAQAGPAGDGRCIQDEERQRRKDQHDRARRLPDEHHPVPAGQPGRRDRKSVV